MVDERTPRAVYIAETGRVDGLEHLLDGTPKRSFDLSVFARQISRAMRGVPTRSIGQHTPEEWADGLVARGAFTRGEIDEIFTAFGYTNFNEYPERKRD